MYKKTNNGKKKRLGGRKRNQGVKKVSAGLEMDVCIYTLLFLFLFKPCIVCERDHRLGKAMNRVVFDVCFVW